MMNLYPGHPYAQRSYPSSGEIDTNYAIFYITCIISSLMAVFNAGFGVFFLFNVLIDTAGPTPSDCIFWGSVVFLSLLEFILGFCLFYLVCTSVTIIKKYTERIGLTFIIGMVLKTGLIGLCVFFMVMGGSGVGKLVVSVIFPVLLYMVGHVAVFSIYMVELMMIINKLKPEYRMIFNGLY
eukprot:TRINITY_DN2120_c0_g2_i10.p1 TRINITY_DN2120_c0_g2~~TRINITY_DN2120_c0_g2_i10.p1  ORF type:complete len:181 (-),score=14.66 TRINITY_DN2120_c0_g2_i10:156-698(-)